MATNSTAISTYKEDTALGRYNNFICREKIQGYLADALKENKDEFVSNLLALVSSNLELQKCTPDSIMFACMKATALKLSIDQSLGQAYIIPYKDNKGQTKAQFQLGWRGYMQLAMRSGQVTEINVTDVRAGELKQRDRLSGTYIFDWEQDDEVRNTLPIMGYAGYIALKNGFRKSVFWSADTIEKHAKKYSKTYQKYNSGTWIEEREAMSMKTLYKLLLKNFAPQSKEMLDAIVSDQAVITESGYDYVDNPHTAEKHEIIESLKDVFNKLDAVEEVAEVVEEVSELDDAISEFVSDSDKIFNDKEPSAIYD
jgi:recombination protein RecT